MNEQALQQLARDLLKEYRRHRRRRWMFRAAVLLLLVGIALSPLYEERAWDAGPHVAVVELTGVIGLGAGTTAERVNRGLRDAFAASGVKAVVLHVNSPGGSPVQARRINREIGRLREEHPALPIYAVVEDVCASGGYYAAVAADEIFADPASIVGSIGVRLDGFGFVEAMRRLGVERRLLTAGDNKGILDPFLPLSDEGRAFAQRLLDHVHRQFVDTVREDRGERLKGSAEELFSGLFWSGEDALRLGLIDGFASLDTVARELVGVENVIDYTPRRDWYEELSRGFGVAVRGLFGDLGRARGIDMQ